mgnify:FL=1
MKANKFIIAALMGLSVMACQQTPAGGQDSDVAKSAKELLPSKSQVDSVSYLLGINFGSMIKGNNFGDLNYKEMQNGINDFLKATGNMYSEEFGEQFKINPNNMNEIINSYLEKMSEYTTAVNVEKEKKFLEANKKNAGVQETESGLQYQIIAEGSEKKAVSDMDTVVVRYKGTLLDGTVFDEVTPDMDPIPLTLNRVIPGWTEGLKLVGEGGQVKLFIPSELGYGTRGTQGIEPYSTLQFDVELVEVHPYVEPAEE